MWAFNGSTRTGRPCRKSCAPMDWAAARKEPELDSRTIDTARLESKTLPELQELAAAVGIEAKGLRKGALIQALAERAGTAVGNGAGEPAVEAAAPAAETDLQEPASASETADETD